MHNDYYFLNFFDVSRKCNKKNIDYKNALTCSPVFFLVPHHTKKSLNCFRFLYSCVNMKYIYAL